MMMIIVYVCVELFNKNKSLSFKVTADKRGLLLEAPKWISEDPLFALLVKDGSLKIAESNAAKKVLENDPMLGVTVEGKSEVIKDNNADADAKSKPDAKEKKSDKPKGSETK